VPENGQPQAPSRAELRLRVRQNVDRLDPSLQVLGEDILGLVSPIDLVAQDGAGNIVLILIDDEGRDGALLTRALAQRAWLQPRLSDWLKLSPQLDIRPDAPIRSILLARDFGSETLAAVGSLRDGVVQLATYRYVAFSTKRTVLLELVETDPAHPASRVEGASGEDEAAPIPAFRSGLSDADLGLSSAERAELGEHDA
jgi:hypothetical protein